MLRELWPLNLPYWYNKANKMFPWIRKVHIRVARISFLVFGKAPVFAGWISELLNVLRISEVLKHLNDLMAIIDVASQSTREFHIYRYSPSDRCEVVRYLSNFGLCTFIIPDELADQA